MAAGTAERPVPVKDPLPGKGIECRKVLLGALTAKAEFTDLIIPIVVQFSLGAGDKDCEKQPMMFTRSLEEIKPVVRTTV
jgi:hypothetical protein